MADGTETSLPSRVRGWVGTRPAGAHAAVWKYDLLTALSVQALSGGPAYRTTVLRLIAAITARYDWRRDEMSVGQGELARLWDVSAPTVKREIARLKALGFLVVIRPGVRGRVAVYRLGRQAIDAATRPVWPRVGAEFAARMAGDGARGGAGEGVGAPDGTGPAPSAGNVVRFPGRSAAEAAPSDPPDPGGGLPPWAMALRAALPGAYRNWFCRLAARREGPDVVFTAPSAFVAHHVERHFPADLLRAARYEWPDCARVRIETAP